MVMRTRKRYNVKLGDQGTPEAEALIMPEPHRVAADVPAPDEAPPPDIDPIEALNVPQAAKDWIRANPKALHDPAYNELIQGIHHTLLDDGIEPYSAPYFAALNETLAQVDEPLTVEQEETPEVFQADNGTINLKPGKRPLPIADEDDEDYFEDIAHNRRTMSAPVSRDAPSLSAARHESSRLTLSPLQLEAAKISGISEFEYANQLRRLMQAKENGEYLGQP
jgi:hypothetical protein